MLAQTASSKVLKNLAIKPQGRPTFSGAANAILAAQALGVIPKR